MDAIPKIEILLIVFSVLCFSGISYVIKGMLYRQQLIEMNMNHLSKQIRNIQTIAEKNESRLDAIAEDSELCRMLAYKKGWMEGFDHGKKKAESSTEPKEPRAEKENRDKTTLPLTGHEGEDQ